MSVSIDYSQTGVITYNSQRIAGISDPTTAQEVATKNYVDTSSTTPDIHTVRAATTVAGTLASSFENGDTIDGITLATNDRILIKNQASGAENGIYKVNASGAPTRVTDYNSSTNVVSASIVSVSAGTINKDSQWVLITNAPITVGATSLGFEPFANTSVIKMSGGATAPNIPDGLNSVTIGSKTSSDGSYNFVAGYFNSITGDFGAVASGGIDASNTHISSVGHVISDSYSFVGGGSAVSGDTTKQLTGHIISAPNVVIGGGGAESDTGTATAHNVSGRFSVALGGGVSATGANATGHIVSGKFAAVLSGGIDGATTNRIGHQATGDYSAVLSGGGDDVAPHIASAQNAIVVAGQNNQATDENATILSGYGNVANHFHATVINGDNNSANGPRSTIVNGQLNTTTNDSYTTILNGNTNSINGTSDAEFATILGGQSNSITGDAKFSTIINGQNNTITAAVTNVDYMLASGLYAATRLWGQHTQASGRISATGDAQSSVLTARIQTTNATATEMFLDGAGAQQRLVLPNDSTWAFEILITARRTDANDESAGYRIQGVIDRNATAATTAMVNFTKDILAEDTVAWDVDATADTTNGSLKISVTGQAAKTINWVARVTLVETTG